MTIAAAYLTSEGVVFGADSTTTFMQDGGGVGQLLNHAQKIFEVGRPGEGRLGLCTWGNAVVGTASHRTIAARLSDRIDEKTTVARAVDLLAEVVAAEAAAAEKAIRPTGEFGYFVGGWNPGTRDPECHQVFFGPKGTVAENVAFEVGDCVFEGAPDLFQRAFHGFDPKFLDLFVAKLKADIGDKVPNLDGLLANAATAALEQIPHCGARDMPIREAIDMVHMYVHLTIKGFKFRVGPPVVGGPIEIAFITTDRLFRWVSHKAFDSAIFQEEVGGL